MEEVADRVRWTLAAAAALPLSSPEMVQSWGATLVVAPHPNDESLGCGGAIALLRQAERAVRIALFTDGQGSHPHSCEYPREKLVALRRCEFAQATAALGVEAEHLYFLDLPDTQVPSPASPGGQVAVARLRALLSAVDTVLVTWRGDPHCDHRAAYEYVSQAAEGLPVRIVEYPVWVWQNGLPEDAPATDEFEMVRVDTSPVAFRKAAAIQAHQSQFGQVITDDPGGFTLPPALLEHFRQPWELFILPRS